jgi:hypothetical protein
MVGKKKKSCSAGCMHFAEIANLIFIEIKANSVFKLDLKLGMSLAIYLVS